VTAQNIAFSPATVATKRGVAVIFTSKDTVAHTVSPDKAGDFAIGHLPASGATYRVTFANAGTYSFHCDIHSSMKGTITVT
jgi:plastocyanin